MEAEEYERMAATEDHMWWFVGLHGWMLDRIRALNLRTRSSVLDCGAGTGGLSKKIGKAFLDIDVVGVDIDPEAVRTYTTKTSNPIIRGSVNELAFASNSFDAIVSADLLYHSAVDESRAIGELYRCLKPDGSLLLNLPAYNWMKSMHDERVHTARRYTASSAAEKLRKAGFLIAEAGYRNSLLFPIMALWRLTVGRFTATSDVDDFPAWQEFLFSRVIEFENTLARKGMRFPFGGSVYVHAIKP